LGRVGFVAQKLAKILEGDQDSYMVAGSGLVPVPKSRLNEIPRVIAEYHAQEAKKTKQLASIRRV